MFLGQTALHLAAKNKHDDCVQLLIKRGALFYNCYDGNSPFHAAASSGSVNCITTMQFIEPELLNEQNKDGVYFYVYLNIMASLICFQYLVMFI